MKRKQPHVSATLLHGNRTDSHQGANSSDAVDLLHTNKFRRVLYFMSTIIYVHVLVVYVLDIKKKSGSWTRLVSELRMGIIQKVGGDYAQSPNQRKSK